VRLHARVLARPRRRLTPAGRRASLPEGLEIL
jgi:hypothetical protein